MAKKFTLLMYDDNCTYIGGHIDLDELPELEILQHYVADVSSYERVKVSVSYLALIIGSDDPIVDATQDELEVIAEEINEMIADGDIFVYEIVEFEVEGAMEDKIVEDIEY